MSHYGEVSENPVTGERAICLTDPFEHPDQVLVSHLHVAPGGRVATAHRHPGLRERFLASPACDSPAFARAFEEICRTAWNRFVVEGR